MPAAPKPQPDRRSGTLTIGQVLARLSDEFPDLSVSKVRFLETEGLLSPQRSGSGYRRYSEGDVERLEFILRAQRDNFWPLKVIKSALEARERGESIAPVVAAPAAERLTHSDLANIEGASTVLIEDLASVGLISPDATERYGIEDRRIVEAVVGLAEFGVQARHLRPAKTAADREVGLIEQILSGNARGAARERQARARHLAQQLLTIHSALVAKALTELR